jgi:hypothetical protein
MTEETAVELSIDTGDRDENERIFNGLHGRKPRSSRHSAPRSPGSPRARSGAVVGYARCSGKAG